MRWVEITIEATAEAVDAITGIMMDEGSGGTAITHLAGTPSQHLTDVIGYLPVDDRLENRLLNIRERVSNLPELGLELRSKEIGIKWVQEEDWATAWKAHFHPIRMGRIVIKPSWEDFKPEPNDIIIDIDPGMAFGTGSHPTTKLCILALQDYITGGETVLDMGTGSGILAMAAAKLGAGKITGLDIDSVAVDVACENVKNAGLADVIQIGCADNPSAFEGQADIVVANIIAVVIVGMAYDLAKKIKPGGKLIASGIIDDRAPEVRAALESAGLKFVEHRTEAEWVALVMEMALHENGHTVQSSGADRSREICF